MAPSPIHTYQIAGTDDKERGFTRQAKIYLTHEGRYYAQLRYEKRCFSSSHCSTREQALHHLITHLHHHGYTQLSLREQFRGEEYLGNQEEWVKYPDPVPNTGLKDYLKQLWNRLFRTIEQE